MTPNRSAGPKNEKIEEFLKQPIMAHMATCNPKTMQPHTVPVWYEWDGKQVWISSFRSTRKVREILVNPLVSLVVDTDSPGSPALGVLFEGQAELVDEREFGIERGGSIYARYLGVEGAQAEEPQSWLHDPQHLLIRLEPERVYSWGFD